MPGHKTTSYWVLHIFREVVFCFGLVFFPGIGLFGFLGFFFLVYKLFLPLCAWLPNRLRSLDNFHVLLFPGALPSITNSKERADLWNRERKKNEKVNKLLFSLQNRFCYMNHRLEKNFTIYYLSISVSQIIPRTATFKVVSKLGSDLQHIQWAFMPVVFKIVTFQMVHFIDMALHKNRRQKSSVKWIPGTALQDFKKVTYKPLHLCSIVFMLDHRIMSNRYIYVLLFLYT